MSAWHHGEKTSAILPKIPYSARATRQASEPASRPKLTPGEKVGVYEVGKAGASASLATVVSVNDETNTVKVDLSNGEQRELPASALVDTKFMKLVNGTPKRRRKKKKKARACALAEDGSKQAAGLVERLHRSFRRIGCGFCIHRQFIQVCFSSQRVCIQPWHTLRSRDLPRGPPSA